MKKKNKNLWSIAALVFGVIGVIADFASTNSKKIANEERYREIAQEEAEKVYIQKTEGR